MFKFTRQDFLDNVARFCATGEKEGSKIFDLHAEMANQRVDKLVTLLREVREVECLCVYAEGDTELIDECRRCKLLPRIDEALK